MTHNRTDSAAAIDWAVKDRKKWWTCPVCDLVLVPTNPHEAGICPRHGEISGSYHFLWTDLPRWQRLIEIRASQAQHEIAMMVGEARDALYNCPRLCGECATRWTRQGFL